MHKSLSRNGFMKVFWGCPEEAEASGVQCGLRKVVAINDKDTLCTNSLIGQKNRVTNDSRGSFTNSWTNVHHIVLG